MNEGINIFPLNFYSKSICFLIVVEEIREDLAKAKKELRLERIPPRAPRDKPVVTEIKDDDALEYVFPQ